MMRILLDLDEVLADFVGGAARAWGLKTEQLLQHWRPGRWDIIPPMSAALGISLTETQFWQPMNGRTEFWAGLEVLPWAEEVVRLVEHWADEWFVVSSPTSCPSSYVGKVQWLKRYFGTGFDNYVITNQKPLFAMEGVLLVDDRESTVRDFVREGMRRGLNTGGAILFPRHHNRNHRASDDPVKHLRYVLELIPRLKYHRRFLGGILCT